MKFTYLLVDFCSVIIPFIFSFHPAIKFNRHFKSIFFACFIAAICFLVWDAWFTANGIWGFNEKYIIGIKLFNLPLEEILFFFCIPFACVFTYHCLTNFFNIKWPAKIEAVFIFLLSILLIVTGIINFQKDYTATTFISTGILLIILKFIFRVNRLSKIFSVYPILLIPFFIVNGILTGTGLEQPVVWYNNTENLAIRILTIPVEDIIYGLELILLTLFFYEKFKRSYSKI